MANPILNDNFTNRNEVDGVISTQTMTVNGTLDKTLLLFICTLITASYTWQQYLAGYTDKVSSLMVLGAIGGFIFAMIAAFTRNKIIIPLYALCEGLLLGGLSAIFNKAYSGIVLQAIIATFVAMFSMLALYRLRLIQCTDKFRGVIFTATLSIGVIYLVQWIGSFFHYSIPAIFGAGSLGIGFSVVIVCIAALNLIIDFDFIERGANSMLPKDYEWYGAFGLMVTLVWLYIEILNLLAKLRNR